MANTFTYIDGNGSTHTYYAVDSAGCQYLVQPDPARWKPGPQHFIEGTPNRLSNQYRATTYKEATYTVTLLINGTSGANRESLRGSWNDWHDIELGEGQVERVTHGGNTRRLDVIPSLPEYSADGNSQQTCIVQQEYVAAMPWWRDAAFTTASGTLTGATAGNVTCGNSGDIPSWPLIVWTGICNKPRVTVGGDEFQVNSSAANNDDTITCDMRPQGTQRMSVYKQVNGTGAKTYLTITSASKYLTLPKGTTGVAIDSSSGTAGVLISYYKYYRDVE